MLVFLGVYSALMCSATSLELIYDNRFCVILMLLSSIVFYGLFTVLETFRKGKLYGIIGITLFFALIGFRFMGAMQKGVITIVNSFLKAFMTYTGTNLSLLSYTDMEGSSVKFCTNLVLILLGVYLIALVSAFFYRRRRSVVFLAATIPFVVLPLIVGRIGTYSQFFTYLIVTITIIGTRHLRTDATDRRMRQKLALILMLTGLLCGGISYAFLPPGRYNAHIDKLVQAKNSLVALTTWDGEDVMTWLKAYFNGDAISYGKVGKKGEVKYIGETMLKLSGDINSEYGLYLKGYVGDIYENNKWSSKQSDDEFQEDWKALDDTGVTLENWHTQLRNELGDKEASGVDNVWQTGVLRVRNIAFGYGNYLVPCMPAGAYKTMSNGRSAIDQPGIDYAVEYYLRYSPILREDVLRYKYRMAQASFWEDNRAERERLKEFAQKHYLQIPESLKDVCAEFKKDYKTEIEEYQSGETGNNVLINAVKNYITKETTYSLAPGKTPSGRDTVEYFLKENKKGYCTYYATSAAILLRSAGIPTRYVEGMYVSRDKLKNCKPDEEIEVLDEDAHAWIEVYDDRYGFVPVEVTPGRGEDDESSSNNPSDQPPKENQGQADEPQTDEPTPEPTVEPEMVTPTPAVTQEPEEDMVFDDIEGNEEDAEDSDGGGEEGQTANPLLSVILKIVILLLLVVAATEGQRRIRKHVFMKNMKKKKAKRRIRMAYFHLVPVWKKYSVVYRGQSMHEFAEEIIAAMKLPERDLTWFVELLFHARFGPDTITEEELKEFSRIYESVCRKAYADATWIRKLYYMYIMVL